jgi:hypothetical protein
MRKLFIYLFMGIIFISCGEKSSNKNEVEKKSNTEDTTSKNTIDPQIGKDSLRFGLRMFTNMEQIPFCIPLPLDRYSLNEELSDERAKFVFTKNDNPKCYMEVQGMFRSNENISLEDYFNNSISEEETEAQGKILDQKVLDKDRNCFWVTGYWSNFPEQKFIELVFLRKEDLVTIYWSYDIETEGSDHMKFTEEMMRYGTECKE